MSAGALTPCVQSTSGRARSRRGGFTLVEVVLVVVLVGIVVAFGWPDFSPSARSEQLAESARRIKASLAMCRAQAMNEARRYRFAFRPSGELRITQQLDPIEAPHEYVRVPADWVNTVLVQESAWVESVQSLPAGPPPIDMTDEEVLTDVGVIEFDEFAAEPVALVDMDAPFEIEFLPDGSSTSARWTLRDERGRGLEMTLDGRLGRVSNKVVEALADDRVERPKFAEEKEPLAELDGSQNQ